MNRGLILRLMLASVLILISIAAVIFNKPKEKTSEDIIKDQYKNHFTTKTDEIGNLVVTVANSTEVLFAENSLGEYDPKAAPLIIVQDKDTSKIKAIYQVEFTGKNNDYREGNIIFPEEIEFKNIDKDSEKELVTTWGIYWGGNDGLKTIMIFDKAQEEIVPIPVLKSKPGDSSHFYLTEQKRGIKFEFPSITDSYYTKVADINNDGTGEVLFGSYKWEREEGHYSDHIWNLVVYELENKNTEIPSWWNEGKEYTTDQKIGFDDEGEYKLMNEFKSKAKNGLKSYN